MDPDEELHQEDLFRHEEWHVGVADPFGLRDGRDTTVLVEAFDYASARGVIAPIRAHDDGPPGAARTVIDCGAHVRWLPASSRTLGARTRRACSRSRPPAT
jgi:hypothetical protein